MIGERASYSAESGPGAESPLLARDARTRSPLGAASGPGALGRLLSWD